MGAYTNRYPFDDGLIKSKRRKQMDKNKTNSLSIVSKDKLERGIDN